MAPETLSESLSPTARLAFTAALDAIQQSTRPANPPALRPILTARELSRCVTWLGQGWTLERAIDQIQAERPSLPFTPEAA